ncbi:signal transduction protein [Scytonema hofmannii PCC 7110]|uniref:Signal transduction protein n=1 Tax=Scytonema hofmannii PCC 7110 TaxID=128403 RepID=A0A139XBW7_9CYAN|nr:effector-associated domain EAD1-containing protein [Scytonema hofmannii]KYC42143.1 signal transduction protein [Scytonema hofmannii PCC 7110]
MNLSGQQRKRLRDALISAFPNYSSLEQLLDLDLDKKLNQITQDSNLQTVIYQLIQIAQAQGWLVDLVQAARKENSGNSELAAIAQELLLLETPPISFFISQAFAHTDIDTLVQEVREKIKPSIQKRCGTIRVLDMTKPMELNSIYVNVNILEKITGCKWLEIEELLQNFDPESDSFDRSGLSKITQERVLALEVVEHHSALMVLGKPGAGKTTFLKYLAIRCINGEFQSARIPLFITLKEFAETPQQPDLKEFIIQQLLKLYNNFITDDLIIELINYGKFLILLDGLDEVREEDSSRVISQIQQFSEQYYNNQFVITCRIAAREYTFEQFVEVEVADFNNEQISDFVNKWFQVQEDAVKAKLFMQKLQDSQPIKELATNPLLLTLLCLVFEERADFPTNRSELYKEGLDVLFKKWDVKRNIERDRVYRKMSLQRKEDLLSQIAFNTFEKGKYFFKQKEVEEQITIYICNLFDVKTSDWELQMDSVQVLKSIEAQHGLLVERARGIYSFSHITFQEYFTAREIVCSSHQEKALKSLVSHLTEKRWQEVFLLTVGMLKNADDLLQLIKQQINTVLTGDEKLQQFLTWVNQKSRSVETPYKAAAIRAFYFNLEYALALALDHNRDLALDLALTHSLALDLARDLALDLARDRDLAFDFTLDHNHDFIFARARARDRVRDLTLDRDLALALALALALTLARNHSRDLTLALDHDFTLDLTRVLTRALTRFEDLTHTFAREIDLELQHKLQQLKEQLPDTSYENRENFVCWLQTNSYVWTEQLRTAIVQHRNIGYDWQFNEPQIELLKQYYYANKLLVDCLKSDCYVSRELRQKIEDTLLFTER